MYCIDEAYNCIGMFTEEKRIFILLLFICVYDVSRRENMSQHLLKQYNCAPTLQIIRNSNMCFVGYKVVNVKTNFLGLKLIPKNENELHDSFFFFT